MANLTIRSLLFYVVAALVVACSERTPTSSPVAAVLGTAEAFTVLAGSTVTNTGSTTIAGNVGVSPGLAVTGFPPGLVTGGVIHGGGAVALQAQADVVIAYDALAAQPCGHDLTGQDLGGLTLTSGVYCFSSSAQLTGALVLDAEGNEDAVFVFQIGSTLTTGSSAAVRVINGARGCNTYWQVGSSATLGTSTAFVGNILALTSISLTTGAEVLGRALARNGAVTLDGNHLEVGTCGGGVEVDGGTTDGGTTDGNHGEYCGGDTCIDLQTDHDNCGACANECSWDLRCVAGACACQATTCGDVCVELERNPNNCGACGNACADGQWCDQGTCTAVCAGTVCDNWCTDLLTNDGACGACGNACGDSEDCIGGVCVCAGSMCGSACVDLGSSLSNCGACGTTCGADQCCTDGVCVAL